MVYIPFYNCHVFTFFHMFVKVFKEDYIDS